MSSARRFTARVIAPVLAVALLPALSPAQLAPTDYVVSAPAVGAALKIDAQTGVGTVLASGLSIPHYGWFGPDGNFYVPDRGWVAILKITPTGELSALSSGGMFQMPVTCIPSLDGDALVVSDMGANAIFRVGYDGSQTVMHDLASTSNLLSVPDGMAYDDEGNLYVANLGNDTIVKIDAQGNATMFSDDASLISQPGGLALDGAGNLFVANYAYSNIVRFRTDTGVGEVFAATDTAKILHPNDLKLARSGGLLVAGSPGKVVRVDALGGMEVVFAGDGLGELDGVSVPEDATLCSGRFTMYGDGQAGTDGLLPQFRAIFSPCPGQIIGLELRDFLGGVPAVMFVGTAGLPAGAAKIKGISLLVDPAGTVFMPLPLFLPGNGAGTGDLVLQFELPMLPALVGVEFYHQVFAADPGAPKGLSASNGLLETIGS
jgi:sugar lactone lactonase YvrE